MSNKIRRFYEFRDFRLDTVNPSLWRNETLVAMPPKVLETLVLLVERRGEIVSREELLGAVWKDTFVEEGNINYTISLLRKTLEDKDLIQTVARRGYRFTADVNEISVNRNAATIEKHKTNRSRWVLAAIVAVITVFLVSFAYFRQPATAAKPPETPPSANPEAMQAYTRGRMILDRKNAERRVEKAIDEFQNAATIDPTFALAYAGLAEGFASLAVTKTHPESGEYYAKARVAAEKSLVLDANLAEGFMIRGWIKRSGEWDWKGAEEDLRRSIQLNPKNALAHQRLSHLLCSLGKQDEALAEVNTAVELDPVADYIAGARFPILEARRQYDQALKEAEHFVNENKNNRFASRAYATFLYHKGDYQKVIEIGETALQKGDGAKNDFPWYSLLQAAYFRINQFDQAEINLKHLETAAQVDTKALYSLAMNYSELGRADEALAALESCLTAHEERMIWLNTEPRFENLRSDGRFLSLVKKMNL